MQAPAALTVWMGALAAERRLAREAELARQTGSAGVRSMVVDLLERMRLRVDAERQWTRDLVARVEAGAYGPPTPVSQPVRRASRRRATPVLGAFTFVLHSHLPYCRLAGQWPHGEEWIHEAAAETYIPLLNALYDLKEEGVDYRLTVSLTPVLTEQLADRDIQSHFMVYLAQEIEAAERDIPALASGSSAPRYLALLFALLPCARALSSALVATSLARSVGCGMRAMSRSSPPLPPTGAAALPTRPSMGS